MDDINSNDPAEKVNITKVRTLKTENETIVRFWFQPRGILRDFRDTTTDKAGQAENG